MSDLGVFLKYGLDPRGNNLSTTGGDSEGFETKGQGALEWYVNRATGLADDDGFNLPSGEEGVVLATNYTEHVLATVAQDGSVTGVTTSTNGAVTDSDTDLCVFDDGDHARVRNRLGQAEDVTAIFLIAPS